MRNPHFFSFLLLLLISCFFIAPSNTTAANANAIAKADVGVILDYDTPVGKICKTCISMAIEDFNSNRNHSTMIVPHFRDSSSDVVAAASAAVDLLKNVQVMAILGPQLSIQADFVIKIGNKSQVPIISPATSPALSPKQSQYFIRSAWCTSYQVRAIAAFIRNFGWREVVFVYEDTNYGSGLVPFWTEDLQESNALISYQSAISPVCSDDQLRQDLSNLKEMQTRVFVVHMMPDLASRFFKLAKEAGMMSKEYAWIIADMLTSFLDSMDSETIEAMQGVIGVKGYTPKPNDELNTFTSRWSKRFLKDNPDMTNTKLNVFGLWAYDSITALADSIEKVGMTSPQFNTSVDRENLSEAIGTSSTGESLATLMRNFSSNGLSGDFNITDGQLQPSAFEIVNVIGKTEIFTVGFWTEQCGISKELKPEDDNQVDCSTEEETLKAIEWPGKQNATPKGWEIRNKFRVGVPEKGGFNEFIKFEMNSTTKAVELTGFSISVFKEAWKNMPYDVPVPEYIRFTIEEGSYDDLVEKISSKVFDAVVGDVTVTADRSEFADFTVPYSESGVAIVVPIKHDERKNAWIFMKPLSSGLWLTIGAFFVFTGLVVWALEHRVNEEFRGSPKEQVGMIFWFSFSTLVFAHKEKVKSNLSRFVLIIWMFAVMVLTTSYTANLTSMLTVDQLQPKISNINDLKKDGVYVGFQKGSFVQKFLTTTMEFDGSMLLNYSTVEEFDEALSKGSKGGGVDAIVDELPYIRLFLSKYCDKYTIIDQTYPTSGLGFAFPKGSPLVSDVSRAILNLTDNNKMVNISKEAFERDENRCTNTNGGQITSQKLSLDSFKGLFLIAGLSSSLALAIFISTFLYENRYILTSTASKKEKIQGLATSFYRGKDEASSAKESPAPDDGGRVSSATSIPCDTDEMFSQNEGIEITFIKPA